MDRILEILSEKQLTKSAFAELVGVRNQNVNAMLKNPTRETYEKIAAALNIPLWQLFASPEEVQSKQDELVTRCPHCGKPIIVKTIIEKA